MVVREVDITQECCHNYRGKERTERFAYLRTRRDKSRQTDPENLRSSESLPRIKIEY